MSRDLGQLFVGAWPEPGVRVGAWRSGRSLAGPDSLAAPGAMSPGPG